MVKTKTEFYKSLEKEFKFNRDKERKHGLFYKEFGNNVLIIQKVPRGDKFRPPELKDKDYRMAYLTKDQAKNLKEGDRFDCLYFDLNKTDDDNFLNSLRNGTFNFESDVGSLDYNATNHLHIIPKQLNYSLTSNDIIQDDLKKDDDDASNNSKPGPEEDDTQQVESPILIKKPINRKKRKLESELITKYMMENDEEEDEEDDVNDELFNDNVDYYQQTYQQTVSSRIMRSSSAPNTTKSSLIVPNPDKKPPSQIPIFPNSITQQPNDNNDLVMKRLSALELANYRTAAELKKKYQAIKSIEATFKSCMDLIIASNNEQQNQNMQLIGSQFQQQQQQNEALTNLYNTSLSGIPNALNTINTKGDTMIQKVDQISQNFDTLISKPIPAIQNTVIIPQDGMDFINSNVQQQLAPLISIVSSLGDVITQFDSFSKQLIKTHESIPLPPPQSTYKVEESDAINQQLTDFSNSLMDKMENLGGQIISLPKYIGDFSKALTSQTDNINKQIQTQKEALYNLIISKVDEVMTIFKSIDNNELYKRIITSVSNSVNEANTPLIEGNKELIKIGNENQLSLKSANSAISEVSTKTGEIIKKQNEGNDLILDQKDELIKIGNQIQTLASYCNNIPANFESIQEAIKSMRAIYADIKQQMQTAVKSENTPVIEQLKEYQTALNKIYEQQAKYFEEYKLIEQKKEEDKKLRREQKERQRLKDKEDINKIINNAKDENDKRFNDFKEENNNQFKDIKEENNKKFNEIKELIGNIKKEKEEKEDNDDNDRDVEDEEEDIDLNNLSDTEKLKMIFTDNLSSENSENNNRLITTIQNTESIKQNNGRDNRLSLMVKLQKMTDGNITVEEIGEIQDLDGKLTESYNKLLLLTEDMKHYKETVDIDSYDKSKAEYDDLYNDYKNQISELSKKIYELSKRKKNKTKASFATREYLIGKLKKL